LGSTLNLFKFGVFNTAGGLVVAGLFACVCGRRGSLVTLLKSLCCTRDRNGVSRAPDGGEAAIPLQPTRANQDENDYDVIREAENTAEASVISAETPINEGAGTSGKGASACVYENPTYDKEADASASVKALFEFKTIVRPHPDPQLERTFVHVDNQYKAFRQRKTRTTTPGDVQHI